MSRITRPEHLEIMAQDLINLFGEAELNVIIITDCYIKATYEDDDLSATIFRLITALDLWDTVKAHYDWLKERENKPLYTIIKDTDSSTH